MVPEDGVLTLSTMERSVEAEELERRRNRARRPADGEEEDGGELAIEGVPARLPGRRRRGRRGGDDGALRSASGGLSRRRRAAASTARSRTWRAAARVCCRGEKEGEREQRVAGELLIHHGREGARGCVGDGGAVLGRYSHGVLQGEDDGSFAENPLAAFFPFLFLFLIENSSLSLFN